MNDESFEVIDDGASRAMYIGASWEEFEAKMILYFPDEEDRKMKYEDLLRVLIDRGELINTMVLVTPHNPVNLDLSDERIAEEFK